VELRHARLVDADLGADLLHRGLAVVIEADHFLLALGQRGDRSFDARARLLALVRAVGLLGLGGNQRGRQRSLLEVLVVGQRRGGFDRVDADDGAAEPLLVRAHLGGQVRERRLAPHLAAQLFAGRLELAALAAHAARPGILAKGIDHGAPDATLGKGLELDAPRLVEPVGGVDQADHPVLDQVTNVDRVRHGGGYPAGKLLHERQSVDDARVRFGGSACHECLLLPHFLGNCGTNPRDNRRRRDLFRR